jgi:N-hydroxyarylamine O-acetyltransferase
MDVAAYLRRIGYSGSTPPTLETLRGMHRAHFYSVPFENLDIRRGARIGVDPARNFDKIVTRRRGGWCSELSGVFAVVLRELGFRVDVIGARVFSEGKLSPPSSHMTLLVHLDETWVADVGFGGRIAEPLRLDDRGEQRLEGRTYVVANEGVHWLVTCMEEHTPNMTYLFAREPREFAEFEAVCDWLQTSPDSRFTKGDIVSLATPTGRKTFAAGRFLVTEGTNREEWPIDGGESGEPVRRLLSEEFGISLATPG